MKRAVLFDLDGTLADSAIVTMAAFGRAAPEVGLPVPGEETVRAAIGWANPEFYHKIYPQGPAGKVALLGERVEALELALLPTLGTDMLFPGVRAMLERLRAAGLPLFIASTGSAEHVDSVVDNAGIRPLFEAIYCGEPDKVEMVARILRMHELAGAVMVGDKRKDSDGARASGIPSAGACWGYCRRGEEGFDHYLDEPEQVAEWVLGGR